MKLIDAISKIEKKIIEFINAILSMLLEKYK